jgi:kynurenine formamidase
MAAGQRVTAKDMEGMLKAQARTNRGILPGDVVYVHTAGERNWRDPRHRKGLSYDAARYLAEQRIVAVGLDAPRPRLALVHRDPAAARKSCGRIVDPASGDRRAYSTCEKMSARPTTETAHRAVRSQGIPAR